MGTLSSCFKYIFRTSHEGKKCQIRHDAQEETGG